MGAVVVLTPAPLYSVYSEADDPYKCKSWFIFGGQVGNVKFVLGSFIR